MSALCLFLESLATGEAEVSPGPNVPARDAQSDALLRGLYQADAWQFPGVQPALRLDVATHGARWLYAASMCYADRSMHEHVVRQLLPVTRLPLVDAAAHYSMDLTLRHLLPLHELAYALAPGDTLVQLIADQAAAWPLSGLGIPLPASTVPQLDLLRADSGLWRMFLDRAVTLSSPAEQRDPQVLSDTQHRLGLHPQLALRWQAHWPAQPPLSSPSA